MIANFFTGFDMGYVQPLASVNHFLLKSFGPFESVR